MTLDNLYREVILDHYRNPRNRAPVARVDVHADGNNPLCGDKVSVSVTLDGDVVTGISVVGQGCSISQASASLMSEAVLDGTVTQAKQLREEFSHMMTSQDDPEPGTLGDLEALAGVRAFPVRIKCANLGWAALISALEGESTTSTD